MTTPANILLSDSYEFMAAVTSGNRGEVRALLERAFKQGEPTVPHWCYLRAALIYVDRQMAQLLITWGARAPLSEVDGILPEKDKEKWLRFLRTRGAVYGDAMPAPKPEPQPQPVAEKKPEPVKTVVTNDVLMPGMQVADGSIYLGCIEDREWYVALQPAVTADDVPLRMMFNDACGYARQLRAHGHQDWVLPDADILHEMYLKQDVGAFRGTYEGKWYWSSSPHSQEPQNRWQQRFGDGIRFAYDMQDVEYVRCVRSVTRKMPKPVRRLGGFGVII